MNVVGFWSGGAKNECIAVLPGGEDGVPDPLSEAVGPLLMVVCRMWQLAVGPQWSKAQRKKFSRPMSVWFSIAACRIKFSLVASRLKSRGGRDSIQA